MFQNKDKKIEQPGRSRTRVLLLTCFFALGLALAVFAVQAQTSVRTNVYLASPGNEGIEGRVTVFDAESGRQMANGMAIAADNGIPTFAFTSEPGQAVIVVGLTVDGYIESIRGTTGGHPIVLFASQPASSMKTVTTDSEGNATLTYTDANGAPVRQARVSVVEWTTFGNARRGRTNRQGEYLFNTPNDLEASDCLAVIWKDNMTISLTAVLAGGNSPSGGGGEAGWPAF